MRVPAWVDREGLAIHVAVGLGVLLVAWLTVSVVAAQFLPSVVALEVALGIGVVHEWMDGDLTQAPGHPWNGVVDILAFLLPALLALAVFVLLQ